MNQLDQPVKVFRGHLYIIRLGFEETIEAKLTASFSWSK